MDYQIYIIDTETTGLNLENDVIELSIIRLSDDTQKTWCLKPFNFETIDPGALRINGHKIEDLKHETKFGKDTYRDPNKVIVEVENWIMEDGISSEKRIFAGQNSAFDKFMLEHLWKKCNSFDTFPFGRRLLDTMSIEFFLDWCKGSLAEGYSLSNLTKKYGITNSKAHSAEADTKATKEVLLKQMETFKKILK